MDSAMDKYTGEIVEAEQLWLLEVVDKERYVCRGCGVKVVPASYQPHNVVRPYFSIRDGKHEPDCDVDGETKLVAKGRNTRLTTAGGEFPAPYPSKLVLRDYRPIIDAVPPEMPPGHGEPDRVRTRGGQGASGRIRKRDANTIRPICRAFINYPYDRDLELDIPGISARTYRGVFKRLKWDELVTYPEPKLFYAAIRWSKPVETPDCLEVTVDAGDRGADKKLEKGYRVRVEWNGWSEAKRTYVRNELEAARKEAIAAKAANRNSVKGYLFFIGDQDPSDGSVFHVTDHRLICCLVDEILYPDLKK